MWWSKSLTKHRPKFTVKVFLKYIWSWAHVGLDLQSAPRTAGCHRGAQMPCSSMGHRPICCSPGSWPAQVLQHVLRLTLQLPNMMLTAMTPCWKDSVYNSWVRESRWGRRNSILCYWQNCWNNLQQGKEGWTADGDHKMRAHFMMFKLHLNNSHHLSAMSRKKYVGSTKAPVLLSSQWSYK